MTDSTGTVVWAADYKPFGEATVTVSTITNNLRFPGQYFDAETGLNYNYYRDYNPVLGRYSESDPSGINGGQNHLYSYAGNNPVSAFDPSGLECQQDSPWVPATVISDPNNLGQLIDSFYVTKWKKIAEWNALPLFSGGRTMKGPCGCLWKKVGYTKISTYIKFRLYEAMFKCCTKNMCSGENCTTEKRFLEQAELSTIKKDELSLFNFETAVTKGFYGHNSECGCDDPNYYGP